MRESKYKGYESCLEYTGVKDELTECKCLCCNYAVLRIAKKILMKNLHMHVLIHINFLTMISISLFSCYKISR